MRVSEFYLLVIEFISDTNIFEGFGRNLGLAGLPQFFLIEQNIKMSHKRRNYKLYVSSTWLTCKSLLY